jgi:3-phenylpropionate/trans-cinnamate dioxygenase ferredoxin subunit
MADFVEVAALDQIKPGSSLVVRVGRESVALFNVGGQIYAINDSCPHAGSSLAAGKIDGKVVTCLAHGLKFDLATGYAGGEPGFGVAAYLVKIIDEKILLSIPD